MNNNQDNFNLNPQPNNILNNNQNAINQNLNGLPNVVPQSVNQNYANNPNVVQNVNPQFNNAYMKNNINNTIEVNQQTQSNYINPVNPILQTGNSIINNTGDEIKDILNQEQNRFINNNIDTKNTTLNDLNVNGEYNNMTKIDYSQDPQVMKNINQAKKNTITITSEGKVFIIIVLVLLLFIFVLPTIFDLIEKIKYQ